MELVPVMLLLLLVAIVVRDSVKVFAETKYAGAREVDSLKEDLEKIRAKLKKYEDEKILDKVRSLDNRFGRL